MKKWIIATIIGIFVAIVGLVDASLLLVMLGGGWESLETAPKAFFITSIVLVGITAIAVLLHELSAKLRQW